MNDRVIGLIMAATGALLVLVAVLADPLGIGGQEDTFGWKQWLLVVAGAIALAAGAALAAGLLKRRRP